MSLRDAHRDPIPPPATLGVIGGGQLGRMFIQAAHRMGYRTVTLSPTDDSPAAQVAGQVVVGQPDDLRRLREVAELSDAVTVEFENVWAPGLRWLSRRVPVRPSWHVVWVAQNRLREKTFLARHGIPLAPWAPVRSHADLTRAVDQLGLPFILKTAASGYDGKGQVRVDPGDDPGDAWRLLRAVPSVAERVVSFEAEVSCLVARQASGEAATYPIVLNRHRRHILDSSIAPAPIGPAATTDAKAIAARIAESLDVVGILAVEFFLQADGSLLVNELAPRPHNSGHMTIEAASSCQFEQQVRTLCGMPLGSTEFHRTAAMVNLLGDLWSHGEPRWADALKADPAVKLHLYGKRGTSSGRKMGHATVLDRDPESALLRALAYRQRLTAGDLLKAEE